MLGLPCVWAERPYIPFFTPPSPTQASVNATVAVSASTILRTFGDNTTLPTRMNLLVEIPSILLASSWCGTKKSSTALPQRHMANVA